MKRPEILSPAGNFEKMKAALRYGADAVYLAGNCFGMRSAADNFTNEELFDMLNFQPKYRYISCHLFFHHNLKALLLDYSLELLKFAVDD